MAKTKRTRPRPPTTLQLVKGIDNAVASLVRLHGEMTDRMEKFEARLATQEKATSALILERTRLGPQPHDPGPGLQKLAEDLGKLLRDHERMTGRRFF